MLKLVLACLFSLLLGLAAAAPQPAFAADKKAKAGTVKAKPAKSKATKAKAKKRSSARKSSRARKPVVPLGDASQKARAPVREARPPVARAYAVDGSTFYHKGQRVRVAGLRRTGARANDGLARQQLQAVLDSGEITLEPKGTDEAGRPVALVRVGGRNVVDLLPAAPPLPVAAAPAAVVEAHLGPTPLPPSPWAPAIPLPAAKVTASGS